MTMIKPLDSFMQLGKQESLGVYEMESEVSLHDTLVKSATRTQGGDPEGVEFPVRIQLASDPSEWMTAFATYTLDTGVHKLTVASNAKVIASSSNDVRVSFSTVSDSLRFSGISASELFGQLDDRLTDLEKKDQAAFVGYLSANVTLVANVAKALTPITATLDLGSNLASSIYTAPYDGRYRISVGSLYQVGAASDRIRTSIRKNGSATANFNEVGGATPYSQTIYGARTAILSATDTIDFTALNIDSADTVSSGTPNTWFEIEYMGKST